MWNIEMPLIESLNKNIKTDILIIGGGITGLSIAYHLKDYKRKITLVERNRIGSGVTSKTTGKLTFLQELIYTKLIKEYSFEVAKKYLESQNDAISLVKEIIDENKIDCDFVNNTSITFTNNKDEIKNFKSEQKFFDEVGIKYNILTKLPNNIPCLYGIEVENTAVFHPLKYLKGLKEAIENKVKIYEKTNVVEIKKVNNRYICYTESFKIECKTVIFAGHYPFFTYPFFFPLKTHIEESFIAVTKTKNPYHFNAITSSYPTKSIRYHHNFEIFLTESHNLGDNLNKEKCFSNLEKKLNKKIYYEWSNQDIITCDNLPLIGRLEKNNDSFLIATGYNTWGMTNGSLAGKIISDIVMKKDNKYINMFDPNRNYKMQKVIKLPVNIYLSAKPFLITKFKNFSKDNVRFDKIDGQNVGIYTDTCEHIVYNICPHLKCSLIFNHKEKTWDCPCHGSRFNIDGVCIKGPSKYNIKFKKSL